jgi:hypothetical protein
VTSLVPISQCGAVAPYSPAAEAAREYARAARAPSTLKAYKTDLADFTAWCSAQNLCPLPATPQTVASYLAAQAETHKASTITRRLSAIGGASLKAIMNQTGHRSLQMVLRYTRDASLFRENALVSTGL